MRTALAVALLCLAALAVAPEASAELPPLVVWICVVAYVLGMLALGGCLVICGIGLYMTITGQMPPDTWARIALRNAQARRIAPWR